MGTTLDGTDRLFRANKKERLGPKLSAIKYVLLAFVMGGAFLGVSYVFLASPLSLITRFYGLLLQPILALMANNGIHFLRLIGERFGLELFPFAQIATPKFATQFFILFFFILLFAASILSPRFWCRYLCPAGAILALAAGKPWIRRHVSDACTACGACIKSCPMKAIKEKAESQTRHRECIVCRTCEKVCPVAAVSFRASRKGKTVLREPLLYGRRQFLLAGTAGAGTAIVSLTGLPTLYEKSGAGQVLDPGLLRPPAALPEKQFLAQCVRCGECMAACPTNTLQPIWLKAGLSGIFSPALTPRRGYCHPECHLCADLCPTGAILQLSKEDRIWAKTGTAVISRQTCLAWEHQKSCMVCDEVCPYKAVDFGLERDISVPVPRVNESKCAGCGYCEYYCPVQNRAAITVSPMGALRLKNRDYQVRARAEGLDLSLKEKGTEGGPPREDAYTGPAPGFDLNDGDADLNRERLENPESGLAPGFTE
jgi:MauM/NapG family ferredoxin protein